MALFALTTALVGFGVPGTIIPVSLSSGALLGGWIGTAVVIAGVLLGSQALFWCARTLMRNRLRERLGTRLAGFDRQLEQHGFMYIVMLRLIGAPHIVVTAGSALGPVQAKLFAAATLIGFLPVVSLAVSAGAAF